MNNWNELNSYAQAKVETRRQEAEEWRLARLARNDTHGTGKDIGLDLLMYALSYSSPQARIQKRIHHFREDIEHQNGNRKQQESTL